MRLSQVDLAEKIGVTRQAVSAYEQGDKVPDAETFQRIIEVLEQPANFFTKEDCPTFGEYSVKFYRKFGADTIRRNEACDVFGDWFVQAVRNGRRIGPTAVIIGPDSRVIEEWERRVSFVGRTPAEAFAMAADWLERRPDIDVLGDVGWHHTANGHQLRIYFRG